MGAEVFGIDVARPLPPTVHRQLQEAFHEYKLLCFRDQMLTTDSLAAFTRTWACPTEHAMPGQFRDAVTDVNIVSNADENGRPNGKHPDTTEMRWHSSRSWRPDPATATLLYGLEVPSEGGDTLFADTAMAYEALPQPLKDTVTPMKVIHSLEYSRKSGSGHKPTADESSVTPPQAHPLARIHPATGKRALFIGCHAWKIEGMSEVKGRQLLDDLLEFATKPAFVYRHGWRRHDLLMWDDRCTLHSATPYDAATQLRTMFRTIVAGAPTN
jgi:alpha-ketoglutarate-dependent taurine dioxygenase